MNSIKSSSQASLHQLRAVNPEAASDYSPSRAGDIVETMIEKISSKLFSVADGSAAHSPVSLSPVLGMMLASMEDNANKEKLLGIPKGSLTPELEDAIHKILGKFSKNHPCDNLVGPSDDNPVVTFNCSVSRYICQNDKYPEILSKHYLAEHLQNFDKSKCPADIIDEYVKDKTNNRIPALPIDSIVRADRKTINAILCNVMEIKANFEAAFSSDETEARMFQCEDGTIIENVLMMHTTESFHFVKHRHFKAISKDFKSVDGEQLKLVVIMPTKFSSTKIQDLDRRTINNLMNELAYSPKQEIDLALPKMNIEVTNNNLLKIVNRALDSDISAEQLSSLEINPTDELNVANMINASIDEQGARIQVASFAESLTRGFSLSENEEFWVNCPSFVVITNGKENLLEATIKCGKFLSTDGDAAIEHPVNSEELSLSGDWWDVPD